MTGPDELSEAEQAEYAELLAAHLPADPAAEALPADVARRLDDTLAELVVERRREVPSALGPGRPTGVAAARRRRLGAALLAAAAVTVGGFAVTAANLGNGGGDATENATSSAAAGSAEGGATEEGGAALQDDADALVPATLPRVRKDRFEQDVRRLLGVVDQRGGLATDRGDGDTAGRNQSRSQGDGLATAVQRCRVPEPEDDRTWMLVRYAGEAAVLVADPADAPPPRTARLLPCAGGPLLAVVSLEGGTGD